MLADIKGPHLDLGGGSNSLSHGSETSKYFINLFKAHIP